MSAFNSLGSYTCSMQTLDFSPSGENQARAEFIQLPRETKAPTDTYLTCTYKQATPEDKKLMLCNSGAPLYSQVCDIVDCRLPMIIGFCLHVPQTPVTFPIASIPEAVSNFRYEKKLTNIRAKKR